MRETINEKRGLGGIKCKGVPKDRLTRKFVLREINNIKTTIVVPDVFNFKTTQIQINGWIKVIPDLEQQTIDFLFNKIRRNIKTRIMDFSNKTGKYQKENIVIIDTGKQTKKHKIRNYQFFNLDIVLYNKSWEYDKIEIKSNIWPLMKDIIEIDLDTDEFDFIKKIRGMQQFSNINE
jgi:hypothetical protein